MADRHVQDGNARLGLRARQFACLTALGLINTIHFLCRLRDVPSGEIPGETAIEK